MIVLSILSNCPAVYMDECMPSVFQTTINSDHKASTFFSGRLINQVCSRGFLPTTFLTVLKPQIWPSLLLELLDQYRIAPIKKYKQDKKKKISPDANGVVSQKSSVTVGSGSHPTVDNDNTAVGQYIVQ
ncbi:hypothetical protein TNCV_1383841 [Trichonephila clavipes]|nr:hypothetical protein TNCV_1383841 [Trichonephila clavipes]